MTWCTSLAVRLERGARTYTLLATGIVPTLRLIPRRRPTWHCVNTLAGSAGGRVELTATLVEVDERMVVYMRPGISRVASFRRPKRIRTCVVPSLLPYAALRPAPINCTS